MLEIIDNNGVAEGEEPPKPRCMKVFSIPRGITTLVHGDFVEDTHSLHFEGFAGEPDVTIIESEVAAEEGFNQRDYFKHFEA